VNLLEYLEKKDIRTEDFARSLDVSACLVWHIISGRRKPSETTARRIEELTNGMVTLTELRGKDAGKEMRGRGRKPGRKRKP